MIVDGAADRGLQDEAEDRQAVVEGALIRRREWREVVDARRERSSPPVLVPP